MSSLLRLFHTPHILANATPNVPCAYAIQWLRSALVWFNIQATMETTSEQLQSAKASSLVLKE